MIDKQYLLTTRQMAQFVADGLLRFDELVPREINEAAVKEFEDGTLPRGGGYCGEPLSTKFHESPGIGGLLKMPQVQGIIQSLVGPNPRYDHHAVHIMPVKCAERQVWHADAIIDLRTHFDVQLFYFAHDTPKEMGGTKMLPGSQYRRINETDISRYHNFLGEQQTVCKAGTLIVAHHGMWHSAAPNLTDKTRYMFKLRLNPTVKQERLWNSDDLNDPQTAGDVARILNKSHGWYGAEVRIEYVNRIRQWRYLTGNEQYDFALWLGRLENLPETVLA